MQKQNYQLRDTLRWLFKVACAPVRALMSALVSIALWLLEGLSFLLSTMAVTGEMNSELIREEQRLRGSRSELRRPRTLVWNMDLNVAQ